MTARESFKDHLSSIIGTDTKQCGLHSLRSRGASEAPNNGVSDRMISKHGCWSSNTSKDKYINDSHSNRFRVSNRLGILTKNFFHPYLVFFSPRVSLQDVSNKRTNLCLFLCIIVMLWGEIVEKRVSRRSKKGGKRVSQRFRTQSCLMIFAQIGTSCAHASKVFKCITFSFQNPRSCKQVVVKLS